MPLAPVAGDPRAVEESFHRQRFLTHVYKRMGNTIGERTAQLPDREMRQCEPTSWRCRAGPSHRAQYGTPRVLKVEHLVGESVEAA